MTKDAGQAQQTNRLCQPLSSYEAGYEAGYRDGTVALKAATERAEAAERELRDCDAARTLVLSENERLANELMAMRAGRKAELEALRTKASLADDMASTFLMGLSAHSPASLKRRHDTLTTPVSGAEQVADREATIHQST